MVWSVVNLNTRSLIFRLISEVFIRGRQEKAHVGLGCNQRDVSPVRNPAWIILAGFRRPWTRLQEVAQSCTTLWMQVRTISNPHTDRNQSGIFHQCGPESRMSIFSKRDYPTVGARIMVEEAHELSRRKLFEVTFEVEMKHSEQILKTEPRYPKPFHRNHRGTSALLSKHKHLSACNPREFLHGM